MRFFWEIVNHIYLVAIHPARNSEHEELQRMGHRERLLGRDTWHRTARNDSPGLGRFFAPYEIKRKQFEVKGQAGSKRALALVTAAMKSEGDDRLRRIKWRSMDNLRRRT